MSGLGGAGGGGGALPVELRTLETTHQVAAVAIGNGVIAVIEEYSSGFVQIVSTAITDATLIFEGSADGVNYVALDARNVLTGVIASQTIISTAANEIWEVPVAGAANFRVRISAITPAAGSVTVNSKFTSGSSANLLGTATGAGDINASVQRSTLATDILVESCDAVGAWVVAFAAANLITDLNHILGSNSLEFDKVGGNALALIENPGIAINGSGFNPTDVVSLQFRLPNLTDIVNVLVRLGTDSTNYNQWTLPVAQIEPALWQVWSPSIGSQDAFAGNGIDITDIQYIAFGVTFNAAPDTLADMFLDHIILRKVLSTGAQVNSEITTKIDTADIDLHEIRGTATAVDHGVSNAGTLRVAANPIDNQNGVTPDEGASDAGTVRTWANSIAGQSGVTGDAGATDAATQRTSANVSDGAGTPAVDADPLPVEVGDGTNQLIVAVRALASVGNGLLEMLEYNAVPGVVADGQLVPGQSDAYGHNEPAAYNRSLGSDQVVEQSPIEYDILANVAKVSAALPAAGAYDTPIEISTGGRRYIKFWFIYVRGAAGGSFRVLPEASVSESGADHWGTAAIINTGAFAAGSDVNSEFQEETFSSQPTGAAAETPTLEFDLKRSNKVRISARELGVVGTPGTLEILYLLSN